MLTDEVKNKIKELSQSGKKAKEIAQELKVSIGTIYRVLKAQKPETQSAQTQPQTTETQILKETISDLKVNGGSEQNPKPPSEVKQKVKEKPPLEVKSKVKSKKPERNQLIWVVSLLALALGFSILSLNVGDIRNLIVMKFKALSERVKKLTKTSQ